MSDLGDILVAFHEATACDASVWRRDTASDNRPLRYVAGRRDLVIPVGLELPSAGQRSPTTGDPNASMVVGAGGVRPAWIVVGPCSVEDQVLDRYLALLTLVVAQHLQNTLEVEHAANELAERYEEINLLYSISEILGRTVSLEEGAATILREVSETVGAHRASILVHERDTDFLQVIARIGGEGIPTAPIALVDDCSVSAHVFRTLHSRIFEAHEMPCEAERAFRHGATLTVPILWSTQAGAEPLGVVNLSDRRSGQAFTAGDQKLVTAIASQIGAAIQNARLVKRSLEQQRLQQEMELAHDLQMKLLPDPSHVAPEAIVAARVVPAEDVGGDFYNLYRLPNKRTGVMIGDVSGHGYQAALIMALTMSASAIHAQGTDDPAEMLRRLQGSLKEELNTTEMFVSAFYAVANPVDGVLRFGNMGHPHAFVFRANGDVERLTAGGVPLGMLDLAPNSDSCAWSSDDLLVLLTDGITDALNAEGKRLDEQPVLECIAQNRTRAPQEIVDAVFALLDEYTDDIPRRDDLTLVVLKS